MELWKTISGFENYEISNLGNVRSKPREGTMGGIIKPFFDRKENGYKKVHLYKKGKSYRVYIHRLVAEHFLVRIEGKNEVNHKDGNKKNNNVDNLEWCSRHENLIHSYDKGLRQTKMVDQYKNGKLLKVYRNCYRASKETGIDYHTLYWCLGGIFNTAGGYQWEYVNDYKYS